MAAPQPRALFKADPATLSPEEKKHLITRNLEVRTSHRRPLFLSVTALREREREREEERRKKCNSLSNKADGGEAIAASPLG